MTDFDLFGATPGPSASANDGVTPYTLGVEWGVTPGSRWLKGYRFWRAPDGGSPEVTGPVSGSTWESVSETLVVDTDATFVLAGSGWQDVLLAVPVPVSSGIRYRTGLHFPNGRFAITPDYWTTGPGGSGITAGPLIGYSNAAATANEQGSLHVGAVLTYPEAGSSTAANYWVTPIITDVDPAADFRQGVASFPIGVSFDQPSGEKTAVGAASANLATLAASTSGDKTATGPAVVSLSLSATVVGSGSGQLQAAVSEVLCSPWATPADVPQTIKDELGLTDAQLLDPLARASELLWALTARQWYGAGCLEEVTLAPTLSIHHHESWGLCGCWDLAPGLPFAHMDQPRAVRLPRVPAAVVSVVVDGQTLAPTSYHLARAGWLERIDGGVWDVCSGKTVIRYSYGEPPPRGGRAAAVVLAVELAKDFYGLKGCRLPRRTTSVTRQGVTIDMFDPMEFLKDGGVGILSADMWIKSVNPGNRSQAGTVWSPDLPDARRRRAVT